MVKHEQCMLQQQELNQFLCTVKVGHSSGLFANNKEREFLPGVLFSNYLQVTFRSRTRLGYFYQKFVLTVVRCSSYLATFREVLLRLVTVFHLLFIVVVLKIRQLVLFIDEL